MDIDARILITGGTGLVGSHLYVLLKDLGYRNVVAAGSRDCDLLDMQSTLQFFQKMQPTHVFHLAACVMGIVGNLKNQGMSLFKNTLMNTHVVEACRQADVKKVIAMGTAAIYPYPPPAIPMREEMIWDGVPHPSERGYSHGKRHMYAQLQMYHESYGLDYAYTLGGNMYGPNDCFDIENGHVIPSLIHKFHVAHVQKKPVTIWGDGSAERAFIYAEDTARALILIAQKFTGAINLCGARVFSIKEIVSLIREVVDPNVEVIWDTSKPNGQPHRSYDLSKLDALGFKPKMSMEEGLKRTYAWFVEHYECARKDSFARTSDTHKISQNLDNQAVFC